MALDLRIMWDDVDQAFAAVVLRDGQPWRDSTLEGTGPEPGEAAADLIHETVRAVFGAFPDLDPADRHWLRDHLGDELLASVVVPVAWAMLKHPEAN
jgi:hypothetical protein